MDPKPTKTDRVQMGYAVDAFRMIEWDVHQYLIDRGSIPTDWHEVWKDEDRRDSRTERVTLRLDADVMKFFRAMGPGHGPRINRILRAYMHARLAKLVHGPDTTDYVLNPDRLEPYARPIWGDYAAKSAELIERGRVLDAKKDAMAVKRGEVFRHRG